ncbi:hypothetical protein DPMN_194525 [Dreissena polymorpha]|uniref:Uncharacterized protein n=2 Tax=Dreissena polymorpha TaxID=45954 RepID=A0A9D3Y485_DREPO|nr:hypothetical protein DPMN_194525 [Dreissena polymorpha]
MSTVWKSTLLAFGLLLGVSVMVNIIGGVCCFLKWLDSDHHLTVSGDIDQRGLVSNDQERDRERCKTVHITVNTSLL